MPRVQLDGPEQGERKQTLVVKSAIIMEIPS